MTRTGMVAALDDGREKARERPIDGRYPEFGREVRRLLGYDGDRPFLTSRMVSRKTGVNHSTVAGMARGDRPSYQTILKLVQGVGGDVDRLLALADYPRLSELGPDRGGAADAAWLGDLVSEGAGITYAELLARIQAAVEARRAAGLPAAAYRVDVRTGLVTVEEDGGAGTQGEETGERL